MANHLSISTDCLATIKEGWKELDESGSYKKKLCTDQCADPLLWLYSLLCPCILQGQISKKQRAPAGRNCLAACCCTLCSTAWCPGVSYLCFDIPDRKQLKKQNDVEACVAACCCLNVCGRIQLANELDVDWKNTDKLKEDTTMSADLIKNDMQRGFAST